MAHVQGIPVSTPSNLDSTRQPESSRWLADAGAVVSPKSRAGLGSTKVRHS